MSDWFEAWRYAQGQRAPCPVPPPADIAGPDDGGVAGHAVQIGVDASRAPDRSVVVIRGRQCGRRLMLEAQIAALKAENPGIEVVIL